MKGKGQISFDLIMAILFALIFFTAFSLLSEQTVELQRDAAVRMQLKQIALDSAQLISSAQALDAAGDSFELTYKLPKIAVIGKSKHQRCALDIAAGAVTVSFDGLSETAEFSNPGTISLPAGKRCGQTLTIPGAG